MSERATWVILNGAKAEPPELREAVERLRARGHRLRVLPTWEAGDLDLLVRDARSLGVTDLVAAGGDGTNQGIVGALRREDGPPVRLGLLPLGTGNDLVRAAGIPLDDPGAALELAVAGDPRPVDLGLAGEHAFLNLASFGPGCRVTDETGPEMKRLLGRSAYLLSGLTSADQLDPVEVEVRVGERRWAGEALAVSVGNGRSAGGGSVLCPRALLDDGELDVAVITCPPDMGVLDLLRRIALQGAPACERWTWRARGPSVQVSATSRGPARWNLDGEPVDFPGPEVELRVDPRVLSLRLPEDCPLISGGSRES